MKRLAAAIIIKTVEEWEDPKNRSDIESFLASEWFNELAEFIEMDPQEIRLQLLSGNYNKGFDTRASYR